MTVQRMHSFLRRIEDARNVLTPLSNDPASRVPHSVLIRVDCLRPLGCPPVHIEDRGIMQNGEG